MKRLRAAAKIEYIGDYANRDATPPEKSAEPAAAPTPPPADTSAAPPPPPKQGEQHDFIQKGVKGLK